MQTSAEIRRQIGTLSRKGLDITESKSMTWAAQKAALEPIETQLKHLTDELDAVQFVEAKRASLGAASWGDADQFTGSASRSSIGGAPLDLGRDEMQRLFKSAQAGESVTVKAPTLSGTVDPATAPASVLPPIGIRREPTRILDRLPATATSAPVNRYYVTSASGGAALTAEGAQKPASDLTLTKADAVAAKIAVWGQVSEEALEDFAGFEAFLTADYRDQIIDAENAALLNATGISPATFKGLLQVTGTQSYVRSGTTETALDAISAAFDSLRAGGRYVEPDSIILNPLDLGRIRRLKSTTNEYLLGSPAQSGATDIWGVPAVVTSKIAAGTVIVGNLRQAGTVFVRSGLTIRTNANGSGFRNNLIEIVAEERLSLAVTAPAAIAVVTIT